MEILAASPGIKVIDEPLNPRRANVRYGGQIPDFSTLMPESGCDDELVTYLRELQRGGHAYMNPTPFRRHHRWLTNRAVFKIHVIEHLIARIERDCAAYIVYLLRHPLATSLSRRVLPRLHLFLDSPYYATLIGDSAVIREARAVAERGDALQRSVVSWCYENIVPLRQPGADWLFVAYEELVLNPSRSCSLLADRLDLPDRAAMMAAFGTPAANIAMSDAATHAALNDPDSRSRHVRLVSKWRDQVTAQQLAAAQEVLSMFGIDAYAAARLLPHARYLHFEDTPRYLGEIT